MEIKKKLTPKQIERRNHAMIAKLNKAGLDVTLRSVGEVYGISRERVRQIYKKVTGIPYTKVLEVKIIKRQGKAARKREEFLNSPRGNCISCGKTIYYKDKYIRKYCKECGKARKNDRRNYKKISICTNCKVSYNPRNHNVSYKPKTDNTFCTMKCYAQYKSSHPKEYGHRPAKFNSDEVAKIRLDYSQGKHTYKSLSKKYKAGTLTIYSIITGKNAYAKEKNNLYVSRQRKARS